MMTGAIAGYRVQGKPLPQPCHCVTLYQQ